MALLSGSFKTTTLQTIYNTLTSGNGKLMFTHSQCPTGLCVNIRVGHMGQLYKYG